MNDFKGTQETLCGVAPSLSMHLKTHMLVDLAQCNTRGCKRFINKSNWDTIRKTCARKLLDEESQRRTEQTDGEEDVKEHSV